MSFSQASIWSTLSSLLSSNPFDKILEKPNIEFEDLINEDQIISEFKNCNPKLMKHFTMKNFEKLIHYITREQEDYFDSVKAKKFPFVSCELLTADVTQVYDAFFNYNNEESTDQEDEEEEDQDQNQSSESSSNYQIESQNDSEDSEQPNRKQYSPSRTIFHSQQSLTDAQEANISKGKDSNQDEQDQYEDIEIIVVDDKEEEQRPPQRNSIGRGSLGKQNNYFQMGASSNSNDELIVNLDHKDLKIITHESSKPKKPKSQPKPKTYLLDELFKFVNEPPKEGVNLTLAGYFSKVVIQLYNKREIDMLDYIYGESDLLSNFIQQFHSQSIANVTSRVLCYKVKDYDHNLEKRTQILDKIFQKLNEEQNDEEIDIEVLQNGCQIFHEIIKLVNDINSGQQLLTHIIKEYCQDFIEIVVKTENQTIIQYKLDVVQQILQLFVQQQGNQEEAINEADQADLLLLIEQNIRNYLKFLEQGVPRHQIYTAQDGHEIIPFSQQKMRILEIIYLCIKLQNPGIIVQLCSNNFFGILFSLVKKHESNNFLHSCVQKIIIASLEMDSHGIRRSLLKDSNFIGFIHEITVETVSQRSNDRFPQAFTKGFLGQITEIGKRFKELAENNSELQTYLDEQQWKDFETNFLRQQLSKYDFQLGGHISKPYDQTTNVSYDTAQASQQFTKFLSSSGKKIAVKNEEDSEEPKQPSEDKENSDDDDDDDDQNEIEEEQKIDNQFTAQVEDPFKQFEQLIQSKNEESKEAEEDWSKVEFEGDSVQKLIEQNQSKNQDSEKEQNFDSLEDEGENENQQEDPEEQKIEEPIDEKMQQEQAEVKEEPKEIQETKIQEKTSEDNTHEIQVIEPSENQPESNQVHVQEPPQAQSNQENNISQSE